MLSKIKSIQLDQNKTLVIRAIGITLAFLLRYSLGSFESGDYWAFTSRWYDHIAEVGAVGALRDNITNYTPFYTYLMIPVVYLLSWIPKVFAIKLISIAFDFLCAFFVYKIVRLKYTSGIAPVLAFLATLFAPTVFVNSSYWGQADIIYTTGLVACIYFLLIRRETLAFMAFGLAVSFKLQAIFLMPLLIALFLKRYVAWKSFLMIPMVYIVMILPAWLAGRPLQDLLLIYAEQGQTYNWLTANAPNLYQWFSTGNLRTFAAGPGGGFGRFAQRGGGQPGNNSGQLPAQGGRGAGGNFSGRAPGGDFTLPNGEQTDNNPAQPPIQGGPGQGRPGAGGNFGGFGAGRTDPLYDILFPAGLIWTLGIVVLFAAGVYKSKAQITPGIMVALATLSVLMMPYFLPKMHDRYFFPADVISIVFGFYFPRYFFVPVTIGMVSLFSYFPFLLRNEVVPLSTLAVVLLVIIIILVHHLASVLRAGKMHSQPATT
jgi:Gpi18-like mannosyltransferase